jgi:hypothetical protein
VIKIRSIFGIAGNKSAHLAEPTSVIRASGSFSRKAATAGIVKIRSPIRLGLEAGYSRAEQL